MPRLTPEEEQRRSFAFGNCSIENPLVTREMVNEEAEKMPRWTPMERINQWADPEFWKDAGCRMDSSDCARELERDLPDFLALVIDQVKDCVLANARDHMLNGDYSRLLAQMDWNFNKDLLITRASELWRKQP